MVGVEIGKGLPKRVLTEALSPHRDHLHQLSQSVLKIFHFTHCLTLIPQHTCRLVKWGDPVSGLARRWLELTSWCHLEVEGEVVYDREGVIVQAKREDRLHSGRLKVTDTRCQIQPYWFHGNIFSHGVFLTWDLELSIQQSASMVTPEKLAGRGRAVSGRTETSLDDYGVHTFLHVL